MKFGSLPLAEAEGAILAHAVRQGGVVLKKGTLLGPQQIADLLAAGVTSVVAAQLGPDDIGEDTAALTLAEVLAGSGIRVEKPFTGRSNLYAEAAGVLRIDVAGVDALNSVDEAITVATLPPQRSVVAGEMVATVKIIPFSVPRAMLDEARLRAPAGGIHIAPYTSKRVAVVSTVLPGLKPSVVDKTIRVMADRLSVSGSALAVDIRVPHEVPALATALGRPEVATADVIVVFGASAITDRQDVIPAAIEAASGRVIHFGMPVDPGNLLLVGDLAGKPVIGAPGCARSPRENGFDWVLQRLLADVPVTRSDVQRMGVGGLLMEIVSRPQPRDLPAAPSIVPQHRALTLPALLLAAGKSSRMGGPNKLLALHHGKPLVRHVAEALVAANVGEVLVVTGHQSADVRAALGDLPVRFVDNPEYAAGLSTSLKAGVAAAGTVDGVIVALGDMPLVSSDVVRRLAGVLAENPSAKAVVPTSFGERGNPVLIGRALLPALAKLTGDTGARKLIDAAGVDVVDVPVDDANIHLDIDTPAALSKLQQA